MSVPKVASLNEGTIMMVRQTNDPFRLPKPDAMYNRLLEKLGDDITNLFPSDCLPQVKNQITGYRKQLLASIHPDDHELKYVPEIDSFRRHYAFKLPPAYKVPARNVLSTLVSQELLCQFATHVLVGGGNEPIKNKQVDGPTQAPEHTMLILGLPCDDGRFPVNA
jgi:hypothetical protein